MRHITNSITLLGAFINANFGTLFSSIDPILIKLRPSETSLNPIHIFYKLL